MAGESKIVESIIHAVKRKYPRAYIRKIADRFSRGIPDLLILVHCMCRPIGQGGVLFVEVKTDSGVVSAIQEAEMSSIRQNNGEVMVATGVDEVLAKLEDMGAVPG